jgi:hypothetical protein
MPNVRFRELRLMHAFESLLIPLSDHNYTGA